MSFSLVLLFEAPTILKIRRAECSAQTPYYIPVSVKSGQWRCTRIFFGIVPDSLVGSTSLPIRARVYSQLKLLLKGTACPLSGPPPALPRSCCCCCSHYCWSYIFCHSTICPGEARTTLSMVCCTAAMSNLITRCWATASSSLDLDCVHNTTGENAC